MKSCFMFVLMLLHAFSALAFNINSNDNVAVYWGQASAGSQEPLASYCESESVDIVLLSFLYEFPNNIKLNFASSCDNELQNGMQNCPELSRDIIKCQSLGKKVFLSLGGAVGNHGFANDQEAESFAVTLWNMFGEGNGAARPFGSAIVDGFDLDIENRSSIGYATLVKTLRQLASSSSKRYYISAASQCPYPDESLGDMLANSFIDFLFIQFYNNNCAIDQNFNFPTWVEYAETISPNPDIKLYIGLPASSTASASGYVSDLHKLGSIIVQAAKSHSFGGIMLWDASQGFKNQINGRSYIDQMKYILRNEVSWPHIAGGSIAIKSASSEWPSKFTTLCPTGKPVSKQETPTPSTTMKTTIKEAAPETSAPTFITSEAALEKSKSTSSVTTEVDPEPATASEVAPEKSTLTSKTTSEAAPKTTIIKGSDTPCSKNQKISKSADFTSSLTSSTSSVSRPSGVLIMASDPAAAIPVTLPTATVKALNAQYGAGLYNGKYTCEDGEIACSADGSIAICSYGTWDIRVCAAGTTCYAYYDTKGQVFTSCNFSSLKKDFT
ncbi:chitinase Ecym_3107 [Eremothecium cymbalariae DBVPG|uniref:chitinase n=1 Tax=Eremothecium cymbalariae (strain CBS 270.75 / DBVPG 7215 / KCTC 17166 / NRRL Y-17582) TaxID=931890 RepID=G8JR46_ERECY|nr:Hypothetical protein Ecym_3107 [Eremothecium cymbalariae DBVPG\